MRPFEFRLAFNLRFLSRPVANQSQISSLSWLVCAGRHVVENAAKAISIFTTVGRKIIEADHGFRRRLSLTLSAKIGAEISN
jgi:hypothetical protein